MNRAAWLVCTVLIANWAHAVEDDSIHQHHTPQPVSDDQSPASLSQTEHVAPAAPALTMDDMSEAEMNQMMEMNDNPTIATVRIDRVEWLLKNEDDALAWDMTVRYGDDFDKAVLKSEGERSDATTDSKNELLWDRIVSRWWSVQAGMRYDTHEGPARTWAAVGVHGLAAYWFDLDASIYVGDQGRTALRITSEYELLLSQRWLLEPRLELNAYGEQDLENGIGSGVSDGEFGVRLRYEIRREFAPYVGVTWTRRFGQTASLEEAAGADPSEVGWVVGIRGWL